MSGWMASSQMRHTTGRGLAPCGVSGSSGAVSKPAAVALGDCGGDATKWPRGDGGSRGCAECRDPEADAAAAAAAAACGRRSDVVRTVSGLLREEASERGIRQCQVMNARH